VYLACLYFSTKQSKLGVDHCKSAITYSRELSGRPTLHHVHREQLPCFEESVETKMGLILLYSFLVKRFVGHGCEDLSARVDIYSGDLFAYYLISLYFNVHVAKKFEKSARETCNAYKKCFINKRQLTVADVLLFHEVCHGNQLGDQRNEQFDSISHTCVRRAVRMKSFKFNTTRLYRLLVQSAVEYLTAFRVSARNFFGFDDVVTSDFQAMYAYKFHLNEECFQICETNVHRLLNDAEAWSVYSREQYKTV
jgi:hypothetical protein